MPGPKNIIERLNLEEVVRDWYERDGLSKSEIARKATSVAKKEVSRHAVERYLKASGARRPEPHPVEIVDHPEMGDGFMPSVLASALTHLERIVADEVAPYSARLKAGELIIGAAIAGADIELRTRMVDRIEELKAERE